jgi:hypothetical protein
MLGGCETTSMLRNNNPTPVCNKVTPPQEVPLNTFTFFPVPAGAGENGVPLVAGLTSDGLAAILGNHAVLKKREEAWNTRINAVNKCLEDEAKARGKAKK